MAAPSLLNLVELIRQVAESHPAVKSFASSETNEISLNGGALPIHVHLEQPFRKQILMPSGASLTVRHDLSIMVLDIPKVSDDTETLAAISRADMIASWIIVKLRENPPSTLQVGNEVNIISLDQYGGDQWAGVRMEFSIITAMPIGACDSRYYVG